MDLEEFLRQQKLQTFTINSDGDNFVESICILISDCQSVADLRTIFAKALHDRLPQLDQRQYNQQKIDELKSKMYWNNEEIMVPTKF